VSDEREAFPLLFNVDEADSEPYGNRDLWPPSGPSRPSNAEKFIIAMSYGFKMNVQMQLKKPDPSFQVRSEYFKEDERALLYAVAVASEGNLDVVLDAKKVAHIAEAYAHGGITLLVQRLADAPRGTLWDDLETEVLELSPTANDTDDSLSPTSREGS
jgi:hypothetical protein